MVSLNVEQREHEHAEPGAEVDGNVSSSDGHVHRGHRTRASGTPYGTPLWGAGMILLPILILIECPTTPHHR